MLGRCGVRVRTVFFFYVFKQKNSSSWSPVLSERETTGLVECLIDRDLG